MELFHASQQWATRPADERFTSVRQLHDVTKAYAEVARTKEVPFRELRADVVNNEVQLVGKLGVPAKLTHWAFGQLAQRANAPASYLRELPPTLAVQNLNHGLAKRQDTQGAENAQLLFHPNGGLLLRAILTENYERIWNYEVCERLLDLESKGWTAGHATYSTTPDRALYASDHDMFAFMMMENQYIEQPIKSARGESAPLYKGLIIGNGEVGDRSLWAMRFFMNGVCGNHIIWGATEVKELRFKHVGSVRERMMTMMVEARSWANESTAEESQRLAKAATTQIAATKEQVLDAIFGKRNVGLTRKAIEGGYDACLPDVDGDPKTVWGMVQGLTRYSQTLPYAEARQDVDRKAGKLMEVNF